MDAIATCGGTPSRRRQQLVDGRRVGRSRVGGEPLCADWISSLGTVMRQAGYEEHQAGWSRLIHDLVHVHCGDAMQHAAIVSMGASSEERSA